MDFTFEYNFINIHRNMFFYFFNNNIGRIYIIMLIQNIKIKLIVVIQ